MDKKRAVELLKQVLNEIPSLRERHYDNQEFKLWRDKMRDIIKAGLDPDDFNTYTSTYPSIGYTRGVTPDSIIQEAYQEELTSCETALKSIIQKYEILGIEEKPSAVAELPEDAAELPIYLLNNMQLHPKIIKSSEALFKDRHYASAILEAFKAVNNFVKEKSGLSSDKRRGMSDKQLMAKVFDERAPLIKLNELSTDTDISEQEGFKFLFMGATAGIRNPKAHDNIIQTDPFITLEYLGFASFLLKRIGGWRVDKN